MTLAIGLAAYEREGRVWVVGLGLSVHLMEMMGLFLGPGEHEEERDVFVVV